MEIFCTGPDYCIQGECGGAPKTCDDENPCTEDSCDKSSGASMNPLMEVPAMTGTPAPQASFAKREVAAVSTRTPECCQYDGDCDDGDGCTEDTCVEGKCTYPGISLPAMTGICAPTRITVTEAVDVREPT